MKYRLLDPIKENPDEYLAIEKEINRILKEKFLDPLMRAAELEDETLTNADERSPIAIAVSTGRILFHRGYFSGRFTAQVTRDLKKLGAKWDRQQGTFKISLSSLPREVTEAIRLSQDKFTRRLAAIDKFLDQVVPEEIAGAINLVSQFDSSLFKMEKDVNKALKNISVPAKMTQFRKEMIAEQYTENVQLSINNFVSEEVLRLREKVKANAFSGNRYESLMKTVARGKDMSRAKAKFIARQETNLLLASYKKARLIEADIPEYQWNCVHASPAHPVRPMHLALNKKVFRWDQPPVVNEKGDRKNPGEDFNCRCFARPIVRF